MPERFELHTRAGLKRLEFGPDVWRQRDVKVVVDGKTLASMPFPKKDAAHQEAAFSVDGQAFVAVAQVASASGPMDSYGLRYDLFSDGSSLTDGSRLATARFRTPAYGEGYPGVFQVIDTLLRIAPAAAIPGIVIAVTRRGDDVGQEPATTIIRLAAFIGAMLVGTVLASWVWREIRARSQIRVWTRVAIGGAAILSSYAVAWIAALAIVVGVANTGFIGQSVCDDAHRAAIGSETDVGQIGGAGLLSDPGPDFTLVWQGPMTLEQSAASRVDTYTLPQLRAAGFEDAYRREWIRNDGTMLGSDIFTFATREGARGYHLAATDYACRYSTESFEVPGGGVGLRILYGSGDPVRDQVAWLDGDRRVLIAIGYQDDSHDHSEILRLVERARAGASPGL